MMDPKKDPARRCLKVDEWPEADQVAWRRALDQGDPLEDQGPASHWSPETIHKHRRGYGRWLNFLRHNGLLDETAMPGERVTRALVGKYLKELERTVAPYTVIGRLTELRAVVSVLTPDRDWKWLNSLVTRLHARETSTKPKLARIRPSAELFAWGLKRMEWAQEAENLSLRRGAVYYCDGLMVALLASRPLRRRNFASITVGRHLIEMGDLYLLCFAASETKTRRPLEFPVPTELTEPLRQYLELHRPILLNGTTSDRLWISVRGQPMSEMSVYHRIVKVTEEAFGSPIHPHLFRDCAATSIAINDPEHVRIAAAILGHTNLRTTERHYNQAQMLEAVRRHQKCLLSLRRELKSLRKRARHQYQLSGHT